MYQFKKTEQTFLSKKANCTSVQSIATNKKTNSLTPIYRFIPISMCFILVFGSMNTVFAQDSGYRSHDDETQKEHMENRNDRGEVNKLFAGEMLHKGLAMTSVDNKYKLILQADDNLVLLNSASGKQLWSTNTGGTDATHATMQDDGNFSVFSHQKAVWSSGTTGKPGSVLVLQNDGNLVITSQNKTIWSSNTAGK